MLKLCVYKSISQEGLDGMRLWTIAVRELCK